MAKYKEGMLTYDYSSQRFYVVYDNGATSSGLHCGNYVGVYDPYDNVWVDTRIEMSAQQEWYLVGFSRQFQLMGARVRIY